MKDLTVGKEYKVIVAFTLPMLLGNMFQQLYNVVNAIVVGRVLGTVNLAAVGSCSQIYGFLLALSIGITLGIGILVSKYFGAKDYNYLNKIIRTGLGFTAIVSIITSVLGFIFCYKILRFFQVPKDTLPYAVTYLRIIFIGMIPSFLYNSISSIMRGLGDSKSPVYFLICSTFSNLVLDILFVSTFEWGIAGAAYATVLSQVLSFIGCYTYMRHKYPQFNIGIKTWHIKKDVLKEYLGIGIPASMQQIFVSIGLMVVQILINGFGSTCMAAYTIASRIDGFAVMPELNIGQAMSNFTAQNLGAKQHKRVIKGYKATILMGGALAIIISIVIFLVPEVFIRLFTNDVGIMNIGITYLRIISVFYLVFAVMQITNGVLLGFGKTFIPMLSTIVSLCLLQVPIAIILSKTSLSYTGIWIATPIGWIGGLLIRLMYLLKKVKVFEDKSIVDNQGNYKSTLKE